MNSEPTPSLEQEFYINQLLREIERQDWAKTQLARQGQQMMKVIFVGMSGVIAAVAAFGTDTISSSTCAILLPWQCIYVIHLLSFALVMGLLSSLFYTSISGLDFVAPYSIIEGRDTKDILQNDLAGNDFYRNRMGVLASRLERNRKHIRALEIFGSLGGSSFVVSLYFTALTIYTIVVAPIGGAWALLLAVFLLIILISSHFAIPKPIRRREPSPFSYFD